ncbi:phosphatidylserine decarboxylase [Mycobacterium sp.]|jgi:phosphatidylserine decarboxylase|uniref:phosphatidylserine decarboxylase n=1 Tax=Mycobacterium sp. TaxID=1785 RepID=UPI002D5418FC|nr:phosphatidylserine decarboxylase [Mycobacterium sp.]HZA09408.1 phosphatidylserine decarboxylase [Mycobacterium sp.]
MARRPGNPVDDPRSDAERLIDLVRSTVPPVHPAGFPFISAGLAVAAAGRRRRWLRTAGLAAAGASAAFFRHPSRVPPERDGVVVAPADGQITLIDTAAPPAELGLTDESMTRVSIFLSLLDAHVQRVPVSGEVFDVQYRPGQFGSAFRQRASEENERNSVWIRTPEGRDVVAVQIAGVLARRIACDLEVGDKVAIGETYGLIRFGSRLDTYVPTGSKVVVTTGQHAVGAETVLAELPATENLS